jgi:hypothetical protein
MPAPGTRRTEVDGREVFLPAETVELKELNEKGLAIQEQIEVLKLELAPVKERVVELAKKARGNRNSVSLAPLGPLGPNAKIRWSGKWSVDNAKVQKLKEDPETSAVVESVFATVTSYKPRAGFGKFVSLPQPAELEKLKPRFAACLEYKPHAPAVKFFANGLAACGDTDGDGDD